MRRVRATIGLCYRREPMRLDLHRIRPRPRSFPPAPPPVCGLLVCGLLAFTLGGCSKSVDERLAEVRAIQNRGEIDESIELLAEMIDDGVRDGEVLYRYGRALSLMGHPGRAFWALDEAAKDPDWVVFASHQLAFDANNAGNYDVALEVLERLRAERPDAHEEDLPARLLEARVLLNTRRLYERALEHIEEILDDFPDNEEAIRLKAVALLGLKEPDEAYEIIRAAGITAGDLLDGDGDGNAEDGDGDGDGDGDDEATAAEVVIADGDRPRAKRDEGEASGDGGVENGMSDAESDLRSSYWCAVRVSFKREAGELDEAGRVADACLADHPANPDLLNEAISTYSASGRFDAVLEALKNAHEADPASASLRSALVKHLAAIGQPGEAEAVLRTALAATLEGEPADPIRASKLWVELGGFLLERERIGEGVEAYDEAIALLGDQASPAFLFRYGDALILAERYDEAIEIAERTPVEVHGPMLRGRVAFERGEYAEAIEELDRAALIWPNNAPIRYYLARSAEGLGDFDRAVEEYRQAMRSDPSLSAARERLIRLHLAEGRVRNANAIHRFISPKKRSTPSIEMKLLAIEIQARLGNEPDLSIPPNAEIPLGELRQRAVESLSRGLRLRSGPREAQEILAKLEESVEPATKQLFLRARVEVLLHQDETVSEAVAVARRGQEDLGPQPLVQLALGRALVRAGQELDEAETLLREFIALRPNDADALASLADLKVQRAEERAALDQYEAILEDTPNHWQATLGRARLLERTSRVAEATATLEAYLGSQNPYDERAALELARVLENDPAAKGRRIELGRRALRFGGGDAALRLLASLGEPTPSRGPAGSVAPKTNEEAG